VAIHLAHVDGGKSASRKHVQRSLEFERDAEVLRKVVEGAKRQDAGFLPGAGDVLRDGGDRPITATRDDGPDAMFCDEIRTLRKNGCGGVANRRLA
jgi:hypothetical protein